MMDYSKISRASSKKFTNREIPVDGFQNCQSMSDVINISTSLQTRKQNKSFFARVKSKGLHKPYCAVLDHIIDMNRSRFSYNNKNFILYTSRLL